MKRMAIFAAFLMSITGLIPAAAADQSLAPTGLNRAAAEGFNGRGYDFAVISNGFTLKNSRVKAAVASEACFSDSGAHEKCPNKRTSQIGSGASVQKNSDFSNGDSMIYALAGTAGSIAPRSRVHAIRTIYGDQHFSAAVDYAISKNVKAILVTDTNTYAARGHEVNCDGRYTDQARAAARANTLGITIFADSGNNGDAYGLSFPGCLTGVTPVGTLDFSGELSESANVGPDLVLAFSSFRSLDPYRPGGRDSFSDYEGSHKATAVVGGIYAALLFAGYSPELARVALTKSDKTIDDVIVKAIPVANYLDAKNWAVASRDGGIGVGSVTQVAATEFVAVLQAVPARKSRPVVTGFERYDSKTGTWLATSFTKSSDSAVRFTTGAKSGWVRLVISQSGKTRYSLPTSFNRVEKFTTVTAPSGTNRMLGVEVAVSERPRFSDSPRSTATWPAISDPAVAQLELSYARDAQITGRGITVAIIDDGVQTDHPYLSGGKVIDGLCLEMENRCPNGRNKQTGVAAVNPGSRGDNTRNDHGTMVAGTIGGAPTTQATGGIAPDVTFIVARVDLNGVDENGSYIAQALEWVYGLTDRHNISSVNMSFGYPRLERGQFRNGSECKDFPAFEVLFGKLRAKGVAPVVAAGNEGLVGGIGGPACESSAIAVGATDNDGSIIEYSNMSSKVDIVAPARMHTSLTEGSYGEGGGTSNSTPVVAGAFALAKQLRPDLTVDEALFAMKASSDRIDDIFVKNIPRLNIRKFLEYIKPGSDLDGRSPTITVAPRGASCEVSFDAKGSKSTVLRYRPLNSKSWWQISGPAATTRLTGLQASTSHEVEVGAERDGVVLWSKRATCRTGAGGKPGTTSGAVVESRGKTWAVAYVPAADSNGHALRELRYRAGSKTLKATWLGADRYLFTQLPSQRKSNLSVAFVNSKGAAAWSRLSLPAFAAKAYSATSLVSSSSGTGLSASQKTELRESVAGLTGVKTITCTGLQEKGSSSSFKSNLQSRAADACDYAKSLHRGSKVVLRSKDTKTKDLVGSVEVVVAGQS